MKLRVMALHFHGINNLIKGYLSSVLALLKAIPFIIAILIGYSFLTHGIDGVTTYINSIDLRLLITLIITLTVVLSFFAVISICLINFIASIRYCKENGLTLEKFYSFSERDILKLWGYKV